MQDLINKIILLALIVGIISVVIYSYITQRRSEEQIINLNNELFKLQKIKQETDTAYSKQTLITEDIKSTNKELQKTIDKKNEEILVLGDISLKWKDKYYQIKNATQTIINSDSSTDGSTDIDDNCRDQLKNIRYKVDFSHQEDNILASGYTLTNPPYAELSIKFTDDLKLELILTKTKDKNFKIYLDSKSETIVPVELNLKIDPSVFDVKWYERIILAGDINVGSKAILGSVNVLYDLDKWLIGGGVSAGYVNGISVMGNIILGVRPFLQ